jgi:hypothetical protein
MFASTCCGLCRRPELVDGERFARSRNFRLVLPLGIGHAILMRPRSFLVGVPVVSGRQSGAGGHLACPGRSFAGLGLGRKSNTPPESGSGACFFESYISKLHRRLRMARQIDAACGISGFQAKNLPRLLGFSGVSKILVNRFCVVARESANRDGAFAGCDSPYGGLKYRLTLVRLNPSARATISGDAPDRARV